MGLEFGGGSKSRPSTQSRRAQEILLESFFPGFQTGDQRGKAATKGVSGELKKFQDAGGSFGNVLGGTNTNGGLDFSNSPFAGFDTFNRGVEGIPTVNFGTSDGGGGRIANPDNTLGGFLANNPGAALTNTQSGGLPNIGQLGTFNTLFEKADAGMLSPTGNAIIGTALSAITTPVSQESSAAINSILSTPAPQIGSLPDPPNIGELATNIFNSLPEGFREFTENILNDSTPEAMDRELDNLSQTLSAQAELDAENTGGKLLSVFAAQGATGGAALEASKELAIEITTRTNATIAQARVNALDTLVRAREQGIQIMDSLLRSGANEQANIVRQRVAELESQTAIQVAKIDASVRLQGQLTQLQAAQFGLIGDMFNTLASQSSQEEQARINALGLPFDVLLGLATGGGQETKNKPGFGINFGSLGSGGEGEQA